MDKTGILTERDYDCLYEIVESKRLEHIQLIEDHWIHSDDPPRLLLYRLETLNRLKTSLDSFESLEKN